MNEHRYEHLQAILERGARSHGCQSAWISSPRKRPKKVGPMSSFWIVRRALEVSARVERDVTMKTRLARFPFVKTLDQFDFSFQPALNEAQIRELATARRALGKRILR